MIHQNKEGVAQMISGPRHTLIHIYIYISIYINIAENIHFGEVFEYIRVFKDCIATLYIFNVNHIHNM